MVTTAEIESMIESFERALDNARRAKRILEELEWDPEAQLRTARTSALTGVRMIADHYPPPRRPARV